MKFETMNFGTRLAKFIVHNQTPFIGLTPEQSPRAETAAKHNACDLKQWLVESNTITRNALPAGQVRRNHGAFISFVAWIRGPLPPGW